MTTTAKPRSDRENLAIIESLKPRWEQLREDSIRNDSERRRFEDEVEAAQNDAEAQFGTREVDTLRAKALDGYTKNTEDTDAFAEAISSVEDAAQRAQTEGGAV